MEYIHERHLADVDNWHRRLYIGTVRHDDGTSTDAFISTAEDTLRAVENVRVMCDD